MRSLVKHLAIGLVAMLFLSALASPWYPGARLLAGALLLLLALAAGPRLVRSLEHQRRR